MKKIYRWVLISFGCLLLLMGIGTCVAWYYKPELTLAIHEKIRENINGEFSIDDMSVSVLEDFPHVTVTIEGIFLRGPKYNIYKKDFLNAKQVQVNVHLGKLLLGDIDVKSILISDADIFIFRSKSGYTNLDIFKVGQSKKKDTLNSPHPLELSIHKILLNNVNVSYQDSLKEKSFGFRFLDGKNNISQTDSSRQVHYKGEIDFDRLQFNPVKGSYLLSKSSEADLDIEFVAKSHRLIIKTSQLKFAKSTIALSGGFHFVPDGAFMLKINTTDLNFEEGVSLLPKNLADKLSKYNIGSPFSLSVNVDGKLTPGNDPAIDLSFETQDALISIEKRQATHVFSKGAFTNHADSTKGFNDKNSSISVSSFEGNIEGFPMKIQATFTDLTDPLLKVQADMDVDTRLLKRELDTAYFRLQGGKMISNISYIGKLNDLLGANGKGLTGKLKGKTELRNAHIIWIPKNFDFENVNARISFTQNNFLIENISMLLNKSPLSITGHIKGFLPFLTEPVQKGFVKLQVSSPDLNLSTLFPENPKDTVKSKKGQQQKLVSDLINNLYRKLEFDILVNLKHVQHRGFKADNVTGNLMLRNNQLQANPIKMTVAGGEVDVKFGLSSLHEVINPLWLEARVKRADIKEFFKTFNNFNQHTINYQNLSGELSTTIDIKALMMGLSIVMSSLSGSVDLTVRDGKVSNFAPLEKMSNFLFKRRDFSDVEFAEIKSTFELKGTELSISRMEVESSVLSLFLEGRYSLGDSTDLSIQVPLSNLKRRDKDYTPKNVGVDSKVGPSVYLRARPDSKGNMSIGYDMFKKFRKK